MKRTFKEITRDIDMVLFNTIVHVDYELELEAWSEYFLYSEMYSKSEFLKFKERWDVFENTAFSDVSDIQKDIFQFFAINRWDGEYLSWITDMPLYYSSICDLYILWVNFLDNWENLSYEI